MFPLPKPLQNDSLPKTCSNTRATLPKSKLQPLSEDWSVSAWSKAGVSTTILVRNKAISQTILLDCGGLGGVSPGLISQADLVFISHAHADHCGGLFAHARSRFALPARAKYFVPRDSLEDLLQAKQCFERLDGGHELKMDFVGVFPGFKCQLGNGLFVECVSTEHRVPSVGYLLYRDVVSIKPEHLLLSHQEKAALGRKRELNFTYRELQLSYSGDTTAKGLDPRMFQAKLAIVECTFVDDKQAAQAVDTQHVLLSELTTVLNSDTVLGVNPNCQLLLVHFSARYTAKQITQAVRLANWGGLVKPVALALAGFAFDPLAKDQDVGISFA
ncbi:hypothetical protein BASA81_010292 [Batrachochytrium salamandrivorans]|nr:hypothetical protein BASA81_010292 [Batrachochytrium salamandrivorans]